MHNNFFDFFFFWIRPVHLDFHRFFLSPNHINRFALPHKSNMDYRTVPELVHGVDFAYMSHEFVNVSTRSSFKTLYSMPYNVLVITCLFVITYGVFIYLFCQTLSNEETDYTDDFCVNVDTRSASNLVNFGPGVSDMESFLEAGAIVSNTLPEDLEEELDIVLPYDSFLSDDLSIPYEHPNSYMDEYAFPETVLFNKFYELGSEFPIDLKPSGSNQPIKIISSPDFWFHQGGRASPIVKGPRLKRVLGDKVEELHKMKHFHQFYNYRVFPPLDHAGDGPITHKQHFEDSRSDPFLIPGLMPGSPMSQETTQDFAEQLSEAVDAWYPEGQMNQSVFDEVFFEIDADLRFNQLIPYDMTTASVSMNIGNHVLPVFNQPRAPGDTEQVRPMVSVDPQDMLIFEPDSFEDSYSVTDSSDVPIAGYSNLSHNFDFGSYFKGPELFPDMGEHVLLPDDDYHPVLGDFSPASYSNHKIYENRGFTVSFPPIDIAYSADAVNFKEEVVSDFMGLDAQLQTLKGSFSADQLRPGFDNKFGFTTLPVVWDPVSPSWKVFNYNANSWVRLTDFLVWAACRKDFLYSEVAGFKGRSFDWKAPTKALLGTRLRRSVVGSWLASSGYTVSLYFHKFVSALHLRPFLDFLVFNLSVFIGSTKVLVEEGDESSFDNPSYIFHGIGTKVLPQWGREEILINSLYGYFKEDPIRGYEDSPVYPYWLRLGLFNTADYLDSVDTFDPSNPTWVSRAYELYAEDFLPSMPLTDMDLIRAYYLFSPSSLRKVYKQFSTHSIYSVPEDEEPLMLARFSDSWFSGSFAPDHPIRAQARSFEQFKKYSVFLKIASYDFSDFSVFRQLPHSQVKELLKGQIVTEDHIVNRDFLAKTSAIQRKKDLKRSAKLKVRVSKMRVSGSFLPIGRLETRLIPLPDHDAYIKLKYINRPPKKMPNRRKVFRRF